MMPSLPMRARSQAQRTHGGGCTLAFARGVQRVGCNTNTASGERRGERVAQQRQHQAQNRSRGDSGGHVVEGPGV